LPVMTSVHRTSRSTSPATGTGSGQSRAVWSKLAVAKSGPAGLKATSMTSPWCG